MRNDPYDVSVSERKRPYRRAKDTRRHVLEVAEQLLYANGIRAVGIDGLAAQAGVTTTTLYRLFGSKDGLVAAYLRRADERWFQWMDEAISRGGLARFFEEVDAQAREPQYRGCPFRLALAEHPSPDSEIHHIAIANKQRTKQRILEAARTEGCVDPRAVSEQMMIVLDGICATATERPARTRSRHGSRLAQRLLELSHVPDPRD
jgi:AcrR family transcriptional regulator